MTSMATIRKEMRRKEKEREKRLKKWTFPKAKRFFKTVVGTDKFVLEETHGASGTIYTFRNDFIGFEACFNGIKHIELRHCNPWVFLGFYDFDTFERDFSASYEKKDEDFEAIRQEHINSYKDWLNTLYHSDPARYNGELEKIQEGIYGAF